MKKIAFYIGKKNGVTFIIATFVLLFGLYSLSGDVIYFFSGRDAIDLKEAMNIDKDAFAKIEDGDFVKVRGITSIQGGAMKKGITGQKHILYYLTGSSKFIVNEKIDEDPEGPQEKTVKGRAFKFETDGNAARMRSFFANTFGIEMDADGILIEAGLEPGSDYSSLIFFILMLAALGINIWLFFKPLKINEDDDFLESEIDEL